MTLADFKILHFAVSGALIGGALAALGYLILTPATDSLAAFLVLRMVIGAAVATIAGPIIRKLFR